MWNYSIWRRGVFGFMLMTFGFSLTLPPAVSALDVPWSPVNQQVPNPLVTMGGQAIRTVEEWETIRRPEIMERYTSQYYGRMPEPDTYTQQFKVAEEVLLSDGQGKRKTVKITITGPDGSMSYNVKIFLPVADQPVPVIMLCNHRGRIDDDHNSPYMPLPMILDRGYGVAVYEMNDVAPGGGQDREAWKSKLYKQFNLTGPDAWQNKGVWTFGGLRVVDYLATDPDIERIATAGQSRGGTLAMWIAANDQRISYCIANNAGHGGFVLWAFKGVDGDKTFWPCRNYQAHKKNWPDWELGVDGNLMISLIAPRLFAGGTANRDKPRDFESQYYSFVYAQSVWNLYGLLEEIWTPDQFSKEAVVRQNGNFQYHVADHKHDLKVWDWTQYLNFADQKWKATK